MICLPEKQCSRCKLFKPIDTFGWLRTSDDGRKYYCRPCAREIDRTSQSRPGQKLRRKLYSQQLDQVEAKRIRNREYREKNRETIREQRQCPVYKTRRNMRRWERELRLANSDERRSECQTWIEFYAAEIERLQAV